ncbi:MAG: DinB family protein, partial [Gemmatimonadaceae bacterium]|nr:DinB family protein [Gemmatimonadaceae bacterium]
MKRFVYCAMLVALPAVALHAQDRAASDHAVGAARDVWQQQSGYVTQAAEDMPEGKYAYKPTPDVRSFGQLIAHVAGSQYMFCAAAIGDSARAEDDIEKKGSTSKAELVAAMRASNKYCARAYGQS